MTTDTNNTSKTYLIKRDVKVGIYENVEDVLNVLEKCTIAHLSEVKWIGNTGGYHLGKYRITGQEHADIRAALDDGCEDTAWQIIDNRR